MSLIHRLVVPLRFPEGLHPGAGKNLHNRLEISLDGLDRPVLRGTAVAGALRHAYERGGATDAEYHFGQRNVGVDGGSPSRLKVADIVLDAKRSDIVVRHHNSVDRHTGAVRRGTLFDLEALPPETTGTAVLVYEDDEANGTATGGFLQSLLAHVKAGMTLGGKSARGIGRVELAPGATRYNRFDLSALNDHARWLDELYDWRGGVIPSDGKNLDPAAERPASTLELDLTLSIPRGQDLLVADGQGPTYELEPQRVRLADGTMRWRLPGSSLRGVLRAWMSRLAAREEGFLIDDRAERYFEVSDRTGDHIAWGFDNLKHEEDRVPDCPILSLFGTAIKKGRIHIGDGYCDAKPEHEQVRMHVAVDRITGGASDGFLFDNTVLCGAVAFRLHVTVRQPAAHEARWLAQALKALDLGLIRLGSSKAVGVVNVHALTATGDHAEHFAALLALEPLA